MLQRTTRRAAVLSRIKSRYGVSLPESIISIVSIVTLASVLFARLRLLDLPLERDEGEFAYMGWLITNGIPPYMMAYSMKMPGIHLIYAFIMSTFGANPTGIHLGLLIANGVSVYFTFLLGRRLSGNPGGVTAASLFAASSFSIAVLGPFAHASQFLMPFVLGSAILLLRFGDKGLAKQALFAGFLTGIAFTIKQHAIFFVLFGFLYIILLSLRRSASSRETIKTASLYMAGAILPVTAVVIWVAASGVFSNFSLWTIRYALLYATPESIINGIKLFLYMILLIARSSPVFWLLSLIAAVLLVFRRTDRSVRDFLLGFTIFSFGALTPGFHFRDHYFVMVMPALSLLAAAGVGMVLKGSTGSTIIPKLLVPLLFALAMLSFPVSERNIYFRMSPAEVSMSAYGSDPYVEALKVSEFIRDNTAHDENIVILGSEPEIYFYSRRKSGTGYIYMYPMMENHILASDMQAEFIREVEESKPTMLIHVQTPHSWTIRHDSERLIFGWMEEYIRGHYRKVGHIDIFRDEPSRYYFNPDTLPSAPASENRISLYNRVE